MGTPLTKRARNSYEPDFLMNIFLKHTYFQKVLFQSCGIFWACLFSKHAHFQNIRSANCQRSEGRTFQNHSIIYEMCSMNFFFWYNQIEWKEAKMLPYFEKKPAFCSYFKNSNFTHGHLSIVFFLLRCHLTPILLIAAKQCMLVSF